MATLAVALFVLVAYTVIVGGDPGPTPGDETAIELVGHLQTGGSTSVAKVVTWLGSGCLHLGAGARSARRCSPGAGAGSSSGSCSPGWRSPRLGIDELKDAVDRPRPPDPLVSSSGSSFPSGHAAHSVFYLWLAVTIVLRLRPGMARGDRGRRHRDRAHRADRPLARLPRRPLPQRRQRRLGAGRGGVLVLRARSGWSSRKCAKIQSSDSSRADRPRPPVPALRGRRGDLPGRLRRP